jgi:hypothetical protein
MSDEHQEEGWYTDPYGRHEARWMSAGMATKLVRDGDVEAYDNPPDEPPSQVPARIQADNTSPSDGSDLKRADSDDRGYPYDPREAAQAAADILDQMPKR